MLWSNKILNKSPIWVSEDLRDGNQAIIDGYNLKEKIKIWNKLIKIGFKQIVLGFPSSNKYDYNFILFLKKNNLIPNNVKISILTPAKKKLIDLSLDLIKDINNSIIHLYNSISKIQRKIVFKMSKKKNFFFSMESIKYIINKIKNKNIIFQYSPESFSDCKLKYAKKISYNFSYLCNFNNIKSILNLPSTVENKICLHYANSINYIKKNIFNSIISIHTHNDMGTAIASAKLALIAGAERIEGTLFGNGERSGNSSIMILATDLYNLGINPNLNLIKNNYKKKTRFPWFSNLNFTAFSGSHQDAIYKSFIKKNFFFWNVIYLPLNPKIFNNRYKNIIKINSQSGKGGLKFIFKYNFKLQINKFILFKIYKIIQDISENLMTEIYNEMIFSCFYCRSNIFIFKKNKILFFNYIYMYKFIFFIFIVKINKKKIIKFFNLFNE